MEDGAQQLIFFFIWFWESTYSLMIFYVVVNNKYGFSNFIFIPRWKSICLDSIKVEFLLLGFLPVTW